MNNELIVLTISELTKQIKKLLEESFPYITVQGELSNFKRHVSGHWYFNLKDSEAVISCTMWKGINNNVFFTPQDGMKVTVTGRITVYPPRGNYQLDVRSMRPAGIGELQAAFEMLKEKLAAEGLFDEIHKKQIPVYPAKIGIITAIDGAAFKDMISVASRRYPLAELVIAPARVQGSGAAETIVRSLKLLNKKHDIDVILLGRGGGSIEDLWAFNEEIVAREIFNSRIPVISGVGHEIDFTISDFVADLRAATPTAAMEMATPDRSDIFAFIDDFLYNSTQNIDELVSDYYERINIALNSYGFRVPMDMIRRKSQITDNLIYRILKSVNNKLILNKSKAEILKNKIESHDIKRTLRKGFALVKQGPVYVTRAGNIEPGKDLQLEFYDGNVTVKNR